MSLVKRTEPKFPSLPRFFDDFFTRDLMDWGTNHFSSTGTTLPAVNIVENNDEFVVEMAAPGMKKEDFNIELDNDILRISSEKTFEDETKEGERFTRREYSYQSFERTFHLPKHVVNDSSIKASYDNGVLRINVPKREEAKKQPPRKISVK